VVKRKTILLVDDVRLLLEVGKSYLNREDCQVVVAQNGKEALKTALAIRPDLVIMVADMPGMDGVACCRALKQEERLREVPVVLIAGSDPGSVARCAEAGCDGVVRRPVSKRKLLDAVRRHLQIVGRSKPRVPACLLIRYGVENQLELHDYSINLSHGGLFIETDKILPVETPLTLEFIIPGSTEPLLCKGRVAWVNQAGDAGPNRALPSGVGVEFFDLGHDDVARLKDFLHEEGKRGA